MGSTTSWYSRCLSCVEEAIEMCLVGFGEVVGSAQEGEACSEQVELERWGPLIWVAALEFPPHQGESFGEPPHYVEAVQHGRRRADTG